MPPHPLSPEPQPGDFYTSSVAEAFPGLSEVQLKELQSLYLIPFFGRNPKETFKVEQLAGGITNKVFGIHAINAGVSHVVKFYSRFKEGMTEPVVIDFLNERGMAEVPTLRRGSEVLAVYDYIEGVHKPLHHFSDKNISDLADFLVRLHGIKPDSPLTGVPFRGKGTLSAAEIHKKAKAKMDRVQEEERLLPPKVLAFIRTLNLYVLIEEYQRLAEKQLFYDTRLARTALCHGDIHPGNIIFDKDDNLKIIDFAKAGWNHPIFELIDLRTHNMNTMISNRTRTYASRIRREYTQKASLSPEVCLTMVPMMVTRRLEWIARSLASLLPSAMTNHSNAAKDFDRESFVDTQMDHIVDHLFALEGMKGTINMLGPPYEIIS